MQNKAEKNIVTICLLAVLFIASFFKDDFSPDYLNTPNAEFIGSTQNRLLSIIEHPQFWLMAIIYSSLFVVIPYFTFRSAYNHKIALMISSLLLLIIIAEYFLIFIGNNTIDRALVTKINRLYHSPLFTLFFIAAFTINSRLQNND